MPAKKIDYSDEQQAVVYVRVPGWLKNLINEAAEDKGMTVNGWAAVVLMSAAEKDAGLPPPPIARAPVPTRADAVRDYLLGETTLEPCGRRTPCERATAGTHTVGGLEFCNFCRVRVS
jgi:hypothetical protein